MKRIRARYILLPILVIVCGLALAGGIIWTIESMGSQPTADQLDAQIDARESAADARDAQIDADMDADEAAAVPACEAAVRDELKSPATAQFEITDKSVYGPADNVTGTISGTVDSQNGFGAMMRSDWTCTIAKGSTRTTLNATVTSLVQRN